MRGQERELPKLGSRVLDPVVCDRCVGVFYIYCDLSSEQQTHTIIIHDSLSALTKSYHDLSLAMVPYGRCCAVADGT